MKNLNNIQKQYPDTSHKRIDAWKQLQQVKRLISKYTSNGVEPIKTVRGKYGGTFVIEELAEHFEKWLQKKHVPLITRHEHAFNDVLHKVLSGVVEKIETQYKLEYKGNTFILDFYIPDYNIAIEYHDSNHGSEDKIVYDLRRKRKIIDCLKGNFIEVKQDEELDGINRIFKAILLQWIGIFGEQDFTKMYNNPIESEVLRTAFNTV